MSEGGRDEDIRRTRTGTSSDPLTFYPSHFLRPPWIWICMRVGVRVCVCVYAEAKVHVLFTRSPQLAGQGALCL